jgi:hypothetical protein
MDEDGDVSKQSKRGSMPKSMQSGADGRDVPKFARLENASGMMARTGVANTERAREGASPSVVVYGTNREGLQDTRRRTIVGVEAADAACCCRSRRRGRMRRRRWRRGGAARIEVVNRRQRSSKETGKNSNNWMKTMRARRTMPRDQSTTGRGRPRKPGLPPRQRGEGCVRRS